jgi:hypothetical protein
LRTPDGSIIVDAELIAPREYRVKWVRQSQGFGLTTESGWLIRGYHVKATTIEQARRKARTVRQEAVDGRVRQRAKRSQIRREWNRVFVAVEDSLRAGNCKSMTDQFASQVWRTIGATGPCAVRADVVLSLRDDYYTRKAVTAAARHVA